jgi:phosphoribosyl 1,2-cyclic phosphodiesterase
MTEPTHSAWRWVRGNPAGQKAIFSDDDKAHLECCEHFRSGQSFAIGDIDITPFTIPHDAADPVGFVFKIDGVRIGMVTDLGYMAANVRTHLRKCDALMIESNHDLEMLRGGPYPWSVKQRVMSRVGHLSNESLAEFFSTDYDGGAAFLILAHLSECNNHPELARESAEHALGPRGTLLGNRVRLASQSQPMESIRL